MNHCSIYTRAVFGRSIPFRPAERQRRCKARISCVNARSEVRTRDVKDLKASIFTSAGSKNGLDRSENEGRAIDALIKDLEATGVLEDYDLTGTDWRLVYSSSTASSSGKIGPFIGKVYQVFPKDRPGQYINKVDFGLLKADLLANYKKLGKDRINVDFEWINWQLGPFQLKQDISRGNPDTSGGFWKLTYTDSNFRVLYSNKGNVFVLARD